MSADHGEPLDSSEQCSLFNVTVLQKKKITLGRARRSRAGAILHTDTPATRQSRERREDGGNLESERAKLKGTQSVSNWWSVWGVRACVRGI